MTVKTGNANNNEKFRFTVDVNTRLANEIERISKETGRTKAEVFRLAIDLLSTARAAQKDGMHVGAWDEDQGNRKEREFVNFG